MHAALQASLRTAHKARRDTESVGPFLVAYDAEDPTPFRNYAIPDDNADPTPSEIQALRRAFSIRDRVPRLEFLPAAMPAVEPALLAAGFVADARLPIMTCDDHRLRAKPPRTGFEIAAADSPGTLAEAADVQNAAYGAPPATDADRARLERIVAAGGSVAIARETGGPVVASGLITPPETGSLPELAAVGVLPAWRRRGLASALTSALCRAAFDRGIQSVMLMAHETEQVIYARVGFAVVSRIAFMSAPTIRSTW